jgi:hypothetical protein
MISKLIAHESDGGANIARAQLHKLRIDFVDRVLAHYLLPHLQEQKVNRSSVVTSNSALKNELEQKKIEEQISNGLHSLNEDVVFTIYKQIAFELKDKIWAVASERTNKIESSHLVPVIGKIIDFVLEESKAMTVSKEKVK